MANDFWFDKALCKGMPKYIFYGSYSERPERKARREKAAKAICAKCPVILQCREYATNNPEYGVWGGESEEERYKKGSPLPAGSKASQVRRIRTLRKRELINERSREA